MNCLLLLIFISLLTIINGAYNPIPIGAVIISTTQKILVMQPKEYGGSDKLVTIYTAANGSSIINTIYDPSPRNLYILFTNTTNGTIYLCQLISVEQLGTMVYQLPISFNINDLNNLTSFTSDVDNRRAFLTDQTGNVTMFSMSGLMKTAIATPSTITNPIRSVAYNDDLNRLFIITDKTVDSCINLDINNLQCCQGLPRSTALRSITFDRATSDIYAYVIDDRTGIYQVVLNSTGCPTALRPINTLGTYTNIQFVIDRGLYFCSGSDEYTSSNTILIIANGTQNPRQIFIDAPIVALHLSYPSTTSTVQTDETCFHGITYSDYRLAVVLAALFGTIMGIFMCFNALFCIDFFMTKRIIRNLKQQIPHNLLEDRWNKLVEEKYAKIALEKQRRKDDPPPHPRRPSFASGRKPSSAATITVGGNGNSQAGGDSGGSEVLEVSGPIPKLSAYLRRKSESYIARRRSDDYRKSPSRQSRDELAEARSYPQRGQQGSAQIHIEPVQEERGSYPGIRPNLSRRELLKNDEDFL